MITLLLKAAPNNPKAGQQQLGSSRGVVVAVVLVVVVLVLVLVVVVVVVVVVGVETKYETGTSTFERKWIKLQGAAVLAGGVLDNMSDN